jgi:hypothetical protein
MQPWISERVAYEHRRDLLSRAGRQQNRPATAASVRHKFFELWRQAGARHWAR